MSSVGSTGSGYAVSYYISFDQCVINILYESHWGFFPTEWWKTSCTIQGKKLVIFNLPTLIPDPDHGAQLRWKDLLGANINPPCRHITWGEENESVRRKPTTFLRELTNSSHHCLKSKDRMKPTIWEVPDDCQSKWSEVFSSWKVSFFFCSLRREGSIIFPRPLGPFRENKVRCPLLDHAEATQRQKRHRQGRS